MPNTAPQPKQRSFFTSIALFVVLVFSVLMLIFFIYIRANFAHMYEADYNTRVLDTTEFISTQLDGDKIEEYGKHFQRDTYYYELVDTLYRMKNIFDIKFLYIMVPGVTPVTYSYVFDAILDETNNVYDDSTFATSESVDIFPGSEQVLRTGLPFTQAIYYNDETYGPLYYAYAPIHNSRGKTVGFLGVDVDAQPMLDTIRAFDLNLIFFAILTFLCVFGSIFFYSRRFFSRPLLKLTDDVQSLATGNLDIAFSEKLLKRSDEFGRIYRAFYEVTRTISELVRGVDHVVLETSRGNLRAQMTERRTYQGSYAALLANLNRMLAENRKILDMMPGAVAFYDADLQNLYRNARAVDLYDLYMTDFGLGAHRLPAGIAQHNIELVQGLARALLSGPDHATAHVITLEGLDGAKRYVNTLLTKTNQESGKPGFCVVMDDVTDMMEMTERAEASSRAKSEFLSRMSHEIRTPMNAIIGMTEIAKRQTKDENIHGHLVTIEKSAEHLLSIINDVLDISKIESGNLELSLAPFDLWNILPTTIALLDKTAAVKGVALRLATEGFTAETLAVQGDEVRLRQVLINLLGNAVKFSPEGAEVTLSATCQGGAPEGCVRVRFAVADQGIGVSPENHKKIFEAFEQGGTSIARKFGGTGLGLPISQRIVGLMGGGDIELDSELGKGSVFSFTLDFAEAAGMPDVRTLAPALPAGELDLTGKSVLLVDDIDINREIVETLLMDTNAQIVHADDGTTALEAFEASPIGHFSLVLMDIQMREMDGYEATRRIRALARPDAKTVKIIAMSANAFQSDIDAAMVAGMDSYITKPVDYDQMIETIQLTLSK